MAIWQAVALSHKIHSYLACSSSRRWSQWV